MAHSEGPAQFSRAKELVRDGFATPFYIARRHRARQPILERMAVPVDLSGCIYRADGSKVLLSERYGGRGGDLLVSSNPDYVDPPSSAMRVAGSSVYLGHHMGGHYGHFITEGLSTFWIFEEHDPGDFDHFVFHPLCFGTDTSEYMAYGLKRFGIPEDRIFVVESEFVRFDEILVPERLFRISDSADPSLRRVYRRLTDGLGSQDQPKKIYLSRRKFSPPGGERVVANENLIENLFEDYGFTIVFPEQLDFAQKLSMFSSAECIAALAGTSLHNSVFMRPGGSTIELGDPRFAGVNNPNQPICNSISDVRSVFIPFEGRTFGQKLTMLFSIKAIERGLRRAVNSDGRPHSSRRRRAGAGDLLKIAYRATRPTLGSLVRKAVPGK